MFRDNNPLQYAAITQKLNYQFRNQKLLLQALTRPSGLNEKLQEKDIGHFQRLEFLGDKVLNLVVADSLMEQHPQDNEHQLTQKTKQKVSNRGVLSQVAKHLNLSEWIIMGKGEEKQKGRHNDKILADTMEALIGAIFLDSGKDYKVVTNFINFHWAAVENVSKTSITTNTFGIFSTSKLPSVTVHVVTPLQPGYKTRELLTAIFKHDYDYMSMLVKHGADLEAQGHYVYQTYYPIECEWGDSVGAEDVEFQGNALAAVVEAGLCNGYNNQFIELLLQYGANPNQNGILKDAIMNYYSKEEFITLLNLLLKYGGRSSHLQQELRQVPSYYDKDDILTAAKDFLAKPIQCQIQKVQTVSQVYNDTLPGVKHYQQRRPSSKTYDVNTNSTNCLVM